MDPLSLTLVAILSDIAAGTLGEAGSQLWRSMIDLIRRNVPADELNQLPHSVGQEPPTADAVPAIAELLVSKANESQDFREALDRWLDEARDAGGNTSNTIEGDVSGKAVQARDIGNLNL